MKNLVFYKWLLLFFWIFLSGKAIAHPMPNSVVNFSFGNGEIYLKIEVPISEFEPAINKSLQNNEDKILTTYKKDIADYFLRHISIKSQGGKIQPLFFERLEVHKTTYDFGAYQEIVVYLRCKTNPDFNNRDFVFYYDAIIHQVVTHFAILKIHQDFENGIVPQDSVVVSTAHLDIASNTVKPLHIKLEKGSQWKGFSKMIALGMHHIYAGLDHILFILLLICIAPLLQVDKKWGGFGGWNYSIKRLLKIITAFTIGHCLTLLIFSLTNLNNISKYIEIAIALSIMITAIHGIKPFFYNKELWVTFFFGLIHGSAFGITLNEWGITSSQKLISLLGFNIGIEMMQLLIVCCCLPVIYISKFPVYKYIRILMACVGIGMSVFFVVERV